MPTGKVIIQKINDPLIFKWCVYGTGSAEDYYKDDEFKAFSDAYDHAYQWAEQNRLKNDCELIIDYGTGK